MDQAEIRLRIDRSFDIDTDPAKALQYLEVVANRECRSKIELLQDLICLRYLPFALEGSLSMQDRSKVFRSVYELESAIQQILALWGISDPRVRNGSLIALNSPDGPNVAEQQEAQATNAKVNPTSSPDVEEVEEVEDDTAVDGLRSTVGRMMI